MASDHVRPRSTSRWIGPAGKRHATDAAPRRGAGRGARGAACRSVRLRSGLGIPTPPAPSPGELAALSGLGVQQIKNKNSCLVIIIIITIIIIIMMIIIALPHAPSPDASRPPLASPARVIRLSESPGPADVATRAPAGAPGAAAAGALGRGPADVAAAAGERGGAGRLRPHIAAVARRAARQRLTICYIPYVIYHVPHTIH